VEINEIKAGISKNLRVTQRKPLRIAQPEEQISSERRDIQAVRAVGSADRAALTGPGNTHTVQSGKRNGQVRSTRVVNVKLSPILENKA